MTAWFDEEWEVPPEAQPQPGDYVFDLEQALSSVLALHARIPSDAFTASTLGVERSGNAVVVRDDGLVLTVSYLVMEAEEVSLATADGRIVPGHVLDFDPTTGFGLVQALGELGVPALPLGDSRHATVGEQVVVGGAGGRTRSVAARIVARQEFAGYWEYALDEAIFTAPGHPHWGGAALIGPAGDLIGVGSLQVQHQVRGGRVLPLNMVVPIELLPSISGDVLNLRRDRPPRPWLGVIAQEIDGTVVIAGTTGDSPARRAGLREGDVVLAVDGVEVTTLADFYHGLWALGPAGVDAPLMLDREGDVFEVRVTTRDRRRFLKTPRLH